MNSHVAKVTTWTNEVSLKSGFFDVSVHQYIPSPGRGDEFAGQCREKMVYSLFDPPPSGDEPLLSGARGAENHFSFFCGF